MSVQTELYEDFMRTIYISYEIEDTQKLYICFYFSYFIVICNVVKIVENLCKGKTVLNIKLQFLKS